MEAELSIPNASRFLPESSPTINAVGKIINRELEKCMIRMSELVDVTKRKRHGIPVLKGTRFTIAQILAEVADGRTLAQVCKNFELNQQQVEDVFHALALCLDQCMAE